MRFARSHSTLLAASIALLSLTGAAQAQTYTDIHDFGYHVAGPSGQVQQDGYAPDGGVTFDSAGNMYGTSALGSFNQSGVIWEITASGIYKILHNFGQTVLNADGVLGPDGAESSAPVTIDSAGDLYGTAGGGGRYGEGMVWEITKSGTYLDLHDFGGTTLHSNGTSGPDGSRPQGGVTLDASGNLFGTTLYGGVRPLGDDTGLVWEITTAGVYRDVHDFGEMILLADGTAGVDGMNPYCAVSFDSSGNMYGTAYYGGPGTNGASNVGNGMVWEITSEGVYKDLHDFGGVANNLANVPGPDGSHPRCSVKFDSSGNLYGATPFGGTPGGYEGFGIAWRLTPTGTYVNLHNFGGTVTNANGLSGTDGENPSEDVSFDSSGNLWGTCYLGGPNFGGIVWKIDKLGNYSDVWDFGGKNVSNVGGKSGLDGGLPLSTVTFDAYGNAYGTAYADGQDVYTSNGGGIVWTIGSLQSVSVSSPNVAAGNKAMGTVTLGRPAPIGGTIVNLSSSDPNAAPPAIVKVAAGATTATFSILTNRITSSDPVVVTASQGLTSVTTPLVIQPVTISGLGYFPNPFSGTSESINIGLTGPAPTGGLTVLLNSNSPSATVPASIFIPAGETATSFTVTFGNVSVNTPVLITGTIGAVVKNANITIRP